MGGLVRRGYSELFVQVKPDPEEVSVLVIHPGILPAVFTVQASREERAIGWLGDSPYIQVDRLARWLVSSDEQHQFASYLYGVLEVALQY